MRVLAATDISEASDVAVLEAAALASGAGDALAVVHVLPSLPFIEMWLPHLAPDPAKMVAKATESVGNRVRSLMSSRPVELFVEDGVDYAAIIQRAESWKADVLVVGSHGRSGVARAFGGVSERILRHAHCSVLVARKPSARGWVVAATDLSNPSLPAITAAAAEARRRGAQLEVVHGIGILEGVFDFEALHLLELGTPAIQPRAVRDVAARQLSECTARLKVEATCKVLDRAGAAAILHEAEAIGAELVVVGAQGWTALGLRALGAVADKVARAAPCSVLVVRPKARD